MNYVEGLKARLRQGQPLPLPIDTLLRGLVPFFQAGMRWRLSRPCVRVDARVISFGNITVGGTGKTPAVIERAQREIQAGHTVAVLTRGYGTPNPGLPVVVPPRSDHPGLSAKIGDEPALIARCVSDAFIIKSPDRVAGARMAVHQCGCDTLILDDGFQYVMLERNENVLVIDASCPFGNGRLLPRGTLREPVTALSRATSLLLTRCDQARDLTATILRLRELCPAIPIRKTWHAPGSLWRLSDGAESALATWKGRKVNVACAIGHPEAFFRTVESLGMVIGERKVFPNHRGFSLEGLSGAPIIMTEKDAVRLVKAPPETYALGIRLMDFA